MEKTYDMIIIGGGPAGYTTALYASRAGFDILVIEKLSPGGQLALTGKVDNYPGFEEGIDGFTLGMKMQQSAERFGAKTEYAEVLSVDFTDKIKKINTTVGVYNTYTVVIATGANPRELGLENESCFLGKGVHYCAHCDGRFYKEKTVVVVGGGNSAAADAIYLSRLAKKVYLVHRRDTLRATKVYHQPLFETKNVEVLFDSQIVKIKGENRVNALEINNSKENTVKSIECDGLFVSIGRKPVTDFLGGCLELDSSGYIIADESTRTQIDGVYAVGDVRTKVLRQIVTAVADGAVAVHYAEEYLSKNS